MPEGPEVKISTDFLKKNVRKINSINIESLPYKKKYSKVINIANKLASKKDINVKVFNSTNNEQKIKKMRLLMIKLRLL